MATPTQANWLDGLIGFFSPAAGLRRVRARAATSVMRRHYEGAASGRRTQGWKRASGDANAVAGPALSRLRDVARDLVRNNGYAESAITTICDHVVGWGITPKPMPVSSQAVKLWKAWADTTACDADGAHNFAGIQRLVMRSIVESGEVLVRRRIRRPEDELPIPIQLQVLEPDFIDTLKTGIRLPGGGRIVHGVELDAIGRRVAYWLFPEHPGSDLPGSTASVRVSAENVLHIYRRDRPGQLRGPSWFAPVLLKFKDFDEYDDATLMKQKVAACLALIVSDPDGSNTPIGTVDPLEPTIDSLEPGAILRGIPGEIDVVQPPSVREYPDYIKTTLHAIAAGLGVSYEDLTGDYSQVNFSSARMARLRHWSRVEEWRWQMMVPMLCDPVWAWAMEAASIVGLSVAPAATWTGSPMPMIEPELEGRAYKQNVRSGLMTLSEALRERGYDPEAVFNEMAADNKRIDELGLVLDSDPRKTSQQGLAQTAPPEPEPAVPAKGGNGKADDDQGEEDEAGDQPVRSRLAPRRVRREGRA